MRTNVPGGIEVIGLDADHRQVASGLLAHGQHPEALLRALGWRATAPVSAQSHGDAVHLGYAVEPAPAVVEQLPEPPLEDGVRPGEMAEPYQRLGVYAVVLHQDSVLLTQFNNLTGIPGKWGLPGGGLDAGEDPAAGVLREVWEETGQQVTLGELLEVQSQHWVGRSPSRGAEDFHAVRVVWAATVPEPREIVIHDVGGTTAAARWVTLAELDGVDMTASWRGLARLVDRLQAGRGGT